MIFNKKLSRPKRINLLESSFNRLIEGFELTKNSKGGINARITTGRDDASNLSTNIDTRFLGNPEEILHGDGTFKDKRAKYLEDEIRANSEAMDLYASLFRYVLNNENANFSSLTSEDLSKIIGTDINNFNHVTVKSIFNILNSNNAEYIKKKFEEAYERRFREYNMLIKTYNRAKNTNDSVRERNKINGTDDKLPNFVNRNGQEVIPKYYYGYVPGTDIKVLSIFRFGTFNISDALKNGELRQDPDTDKILGLKGEEDREKIDKVFGGQLQGKKVKVTYDDEIDPVISNNFSLDDENIDDKEHLGRKNMTGSYTSTAQFIDKSIMGAALAIRKENISADYIIAAPSSSKFNDYYCKRLSDKTGINYIKDFFKRNLIDASIDEESMRKDGYDEAEIEALKRKIVSAALGDIIEEISNPIDNFISIHKEYLTMSKTPHKRGRKKSGDIVSVDPKNLSSVIKSYVIGEIINAINNKEFGLDIDKFSNYNEKGSGKIFSLNTNKGRFECNFTDRGSLFNTLKNRFPNFTDELINRLIDNQGNYKLKEYTLRSKYLVEGAAAVSKSLETYLVELMENYNNKLMNKYNIDGINYSDLIYNFSKYIKNDNSFMKCVSETLNLVKKYAKMIIEGYKPQLFEQKKFKITEIKFSMRRYIKNTYIIADKNFNKNYELIKSIKNGRFIIFDEDMNTGATFIILADALEQYGIMHRQITCLVNAFKLKG
jgi:hypothetical protein